MTTTTPAAPAKLSYTVVPMQNDFDSLFAAIATLTGKSSPEDIKKIAVEKQLIPAHGPYWAGDDVLIAKIFAALGWVSSVWKEAESLAELPSLALVLEDYDEETDLGRFVMFYRQLVNPPSKQEVSVLLDPAYWLSPEQRIRRDLKDVKGPIWFIGVSQMGKTATK